MTGASRPGRRRLLPRLGPGILFAATSVGASHLLMAPEAGARFGYRLAWLVVVAHLLKYQAFACAPRYVAARGESLLAAWARVPGPRLWAIRLGLVDLTLQAAVLIAALVGLTASFLREAVGGPPLAAWSLGLLALLFALLALGRYRLLLGVNAVLMLALGGGTLVAFGAAFAAGEPGAASGGGGWSERLAQGLPGGSLVLVAAILGYMPTSVGVSLMQSLWALEEGRLRGAAGRPLEERRRLLAEGLFDLRVGYVFSLGLAVAFLALGARLLEPRGLVPEGPEVALVLSRLYTLVLGEWMRPVILALAFFALFTTCYTTADGLPRAFVAARRVLAAGHARGGSAGAEGWSVQGRSYWTFLAATSGGGLALLAALPDPALLIKAVAAFGLLLSPVFFALNLWAVTRGIDEPELRLGGVGVAVGGVGVSFLTGVAGLLVATLF